MKITKRRIKNVEQFTKLYAQNEKLVIIIACLYLLIN